ncbi:acid-resistance membrane protein [Pirellulimonas nuda]|uniref:Acid-resistance membrane protein n=1 Tax=Pirellulimonas nuda TaxID=2528009 RepID=A0A518DIH1_9BACT|nr:HdeD family acid-resistance protein [Pirellulimonas nuda]QDU91266.1 acid-resistance membrane protein [Pirellulimonas nuda]
MDSPAPAATVPAIDIENVRRKWGWFLALGVGLILLGMAALGATAVTAVVWSMMFGWIVVIGGVFETVVAFSARKWSGFLLQLLVGVLNVVVGVLIVAHPVAAAAGLTMLLAALFLTTGLFRAISALALQYPNWGWALVDGLISIVLGVMIAVEWPGSTQWVIGTFIAVVLLFRGFSWVMFALAAKSGPAAA